MTLVTVPVKRKSPKRGEDVGDRSPSDEEGELAPVYDFNCDKCCSTELTIVDIKCMEKQIEELEQQLTESKIKNASLKFTLAYIADND